MKASFILLVLVTLMLRMNGSGQSAQLPPASDMKTIGLIGGTSWYSTVDYYRYINEAVNDAYGNNTNPPLILYNMNQERIHELQAKGQWDEIAALLTPSNYPARVEQGHLQGREQEVCPPANRRTAKTRSARHRSGMHGIPPYYQVPGR